MIHMIEPTDPKERQAAIRICRANAHLDVETGEPLGDSDVSQKQWRELTDDVPYSKWIWMWNHGISEWDPRYAHQPSEPRS